MDGRRIEQKIIKGDAYKLIKEVKDKSIDLIITDPPYDIKGIHGSGIVKDRGVSFHKELEAKNLDKGLNSAILDDFCRVMKKINIYIWCNKEQIIQYLDYFVKKKGCNYDILIWAKEDPIPFCGTHYLVDKEYCLYFWEQGAPVKIPYERGKTFFLGRKNVIDKNDYGHPTIKPIDIIETLVRNSSVEGGEVLDPFVGSGTTALACKHTKRSFIGFEIDEEYYKIASDRIRGINKRGELNLFDITED